MRRTLTILLLLASLACRKAPEAPVRVLVTGQVAETGLAQMLAERFSSSAHVSLRIERVGGASLSGYDFRKLPAAVLTDDSKLVESFRAKQMLTALIARDDFLIVGPASDPAHIGSSRDAAEAFRRIAAQNRAFCSAVDVTSWRRREEEIWKSAGVAPENNRRYRSCHGDASRVIRDTESRRGYALVHASASPAVQRAKLDVLVRGVAGLRTDYWIVLAAGRRPPKNTAWFVEWTMSQAARQMIAQHQVGGETRFSAP